MGIFPEALKGLKSVFGIGFLRGRGGGSFKFGN
jgi:hypothetical protein